MTDMSKVFAISNERMVILERGTTDEVIRMAKKYNIHQTGDISRAYIEMVERIKARLVKDGVDPETVRSE
jgi:hypothetical protein